MKTNKLKTMMKGLMVVLLTAGLAVSASAQRAAHFSGGGGFRGGTRVVYAGPSIGLGLGFGWGYYPYGWYGPYGPYPPYYYGYGAMPTELSQHINDIKSDYDAQIKDVKHDKALTRKEKRAKVDELKKERDNAVIQARRDYFNAHYGRQRQPGTYQNNDDQQQQPQQQNNNNGSNGSKPTESSNSESPEYQQSNTSTNSNTQQ